MTEEVSNNSNGQEAKKKQKSKLYFDSVYEQLEDGNPMLKEQKQFWTTKGNSKNYTCTLCNIPVQMSPNPNAMMVALKSHMGDKYHKKRYDTYLKSEGSLHLDDKGNSQKNCLPDFGSVYELVDFDSVYSTFERSNPVVRTSKKFIIKHGSSSHYYCRLCDVLIFNSSSASEFKYNLFVHLNEESHREKLPNYSKVVIEFEGIMETLSQTLPDDLKNEVEHFKVGQVFRFVTCSLCDIAVSTNLHRLKNHIEGEEHVEKNRSAKMGQLRIKPRHERNRNAFQKLVVKLDDKFKKDIKYIQIGKIPGYVLCSLCTYVVLPTKFFVETHFGSEVHVTNKKSSLGSSQFVTNFKSEVHVKNKKSKSEVHEKNNKSSLGSRQLKLKTSLVDLMKTLPGDLRGFFDIFEEDLCGLTCKRCNATIPATSYDLYSHITKERHTYVEK